MQVAASAEHAIVGCLLGTAVGDALGLPLEGLSRRRVRRLRHDLSRYRLFFGRGMFSDDTEHACLTAQALAESAGESALFTRALSRRLKRWFLALPPGIGPATLKACLKLTVGFPPDRSGTRSAGNGPAMRSPVIGVFFGHRVDDMRAHVRTSTRITHLDPRAELGALAVALAASLSARWPSSSGIAQAYLDLLESVLGPDPDELKDLIARAAESAQVGQTTTQFAADIGCKRGVSGFVYRTVPVAVHAWLLHPADFLPAVTSTIECGGDTDTVAAITGAIVGARVGKEGIPADLLRRLAEWPRSVRWIESLASRVLQALSSGQRQVVPDPPLPACQIRNLFLLCIVLAHGFRRLFPPY